MGSENLNLFGEINEQFEGTGGAQKISVSHHQLINGVQSQKASDSFVVDIERFTSHFATDKDIKANSRITRSLSRKGSQQQRGGVDKKSSFVTNDRENSSLTISPRASLMHGGSTPEKPMVVVVGATDHHTHNPQVHNPITIMTGSLAGGGTTALAECKGLNSTISRRFSFRRSSTAFFDPRKILLFFATLSSMGTILLIFFTLSMNKLNGVDDGLN